MMEDVTGQGPQPAEAPINSEPSGTNEVDEALAAAKRQRRIFFFSFGTILFMGLALAILYLGGRVMETKAAGTPVPNPQPVAAPATTKQAVIAQAKTTAMPLPKTVPETKTATAPKPDLIAKAVAVPAPKPPAFAEPKNAPASKPVAVAEAKTAPMPKPAAAVQVQAKPIPQTNAPAIAKTTTSKAAPAVSVRAARPAREESIIDGSLPRSPNPYGGPMLKPRAGDTYVQVGAYSPNYTPSFLAVLEKKGFHAVVAPGPAPDVFRVLIGPFGDHSAMKNTFAQVEKAGISDAFDRTY